MVAPVPKTQAAELFSAFNALVKSHAEISQFQLAAFLRDAKTQLAYDAVMAYVLLGAISAYKFEIEEMRRCFNAAIALEDSDLTRGNYSISLQLTGFITEAFEQAEIVSARFPENLSALRVAVHFAWQAGLISNTKNLCLDFLKRSTKIDQDIKETAMICDSALSVLHGRDIPVDTYHRTVALAYDVLRLASVRPKGHEVVVDSDFDDLSISYKIFISSNDITPSVLDELQEAFVIRCVDELGEAWHPECVMLEFDAIDISEIPDTASYH